MSRDHSGRSFVDTTTHHGGCLSVARITKVPNAMHIKLNFDGGEVHVLDGRGSELECKCRAGSRPKKCEGY